MCLEAARRFLSLEELLKLLGFDDDDRFHEGLFAELGIVGRVEGVDGVADDLLVVWSGGDVSDGHEAH